MGGYSGGLRPMRRFGVEAPRNPEAGLTAARRNVAASPFVRGAHIWVDGFSGFTAQERQILVELARHCDTMHIALCLDPTTLDLDNTDTQTLDPAGLFYTTEQTYADLLGIFRKCRFEVLPPDILNRPLRFTPTPALGHIETALASNTTDVVASKGQWISSAARICAAKRMGTTVLRTGTQQGLSLSADRRSCTGYGTVWGLSGIGVRTMRFRVFRSSDHGSPSSPGRDPSGGAGRGQGLLHHRYFVFSKKRPDRYHK